MKVEMPLNQGIGRTLRELREARGIRKERIALALEMSAQNWALYEAGKQKLTVAMLPTVADIYSMTFAELVTELLKEPTSTVQLSQDDTLDIEECPTETKSHYSETEWARSGNAARYVIKDRSPQRELIAV